MENKDTRWVCPSCGTKYFTGAFKSMRICPACGKENENFKKEWKTNEKS